MHIKERGLQMRILLYLTISLVIVVGCGGDVMKEPEVIMEPIAQHLQIQDQIQEQLSLPPVITKNPMEKPNPSRYGFTDKEIYLLTVLLCGSAKKDGDGEYDFDYEKNVNRQQISLVLNVVMNRVKSEKYPDTVSEVVWGKGQFSYMPHWKKGLPKVDEASYQVVRQWCLNYDAGKNTAFAIPNNHLYFSGNGTINKSRARP